MTRRTQRVNRLLREEIGLFLQRQLRDPRLSPLVSVTRVETSADLRQAKVFVSVMGGRSVKDEVLNALESAAGYMQRGLGGTLPLRRVPYLTFLLDDSMEQAAEVLKVLDSLAHKASRHTVDESQEHSNNLSDQSHE